MEDNLGMIPSEAATRATSTDKKPTELEDLLQRLHNVERDLRATLISFEESLISLRGHRPSEEPDSEETPNPSSKFAELDAVSADLQTVQNRLNAQAIEFRRLI